MLLLDNREVRQGWQALKDDIAGVFRKHGTAMKSSRLWDERRLAYPIQRQRRGTYLLVYFESETNALAGLRRDLELSEKVLRNLIRTCEEIPATAFEPEAEFDESRIREEDVAASAAPAPEAAQPEAADADDGDGEDGGDGDRRQSRRGERSDEAGGSTAAGESNEEGDER
jgi:small subunit ribosomal protein S6